MNWLIMTNSTEHVDARNPVKVDVHVQTDDESFKNIFFSMMKLLRKFSHSKKKLISMEQPSGNSGRTWQPRRVVQPQTEVQQANYSSFVLIID